MINEKPLSLEDAELAYAFVDRGTVGDCIQDQYLKIFCHLMSTEVNSSSAMENPQLVYDSNSYRSSGNYREISDIGQVPEYTLSREKKIFAGFKYPVPASDLYIGSFNMRLIFPLLKAVSIMGASCDTTLMSKAPYTMRVDITEFTNIWDNDRDSILRRMWDPSALKPNIVMSGKLKYLSDRIFEPKDLFNVIRLPYNPNI